MMARTIGDARRSGNRIGDRARQMRGRSR